MDKIEKKFINREEIIKNINYISESVDIRKKFSNINLFIIYEINIIKDMLENNLTSYRKFVPCLRAKHCIEEFNFNLDSNRFEECFYNIYEVVESDKNKIYHNLIEKNSGYEYSKLISIEEKSVVLDMINKLIDKINSVKSEDNEIVKKIYTQEDLKTFFYRQMNEKEKQKMEELNLNDKISKLITSSYQIKYLDNVGYIFIGEGYLILEDGAELTNYFAKVFKTKEEAMNEIEKNFNK